MTRPMRTFDIFWSPTGRKIATVKATTAKAAKRKAPYPYRRYLGEIYVTEIEKRENPRKLSTTWTSARVRRLPGGRVHIHILRHTRPRNTRKRRRTR